MSGDDETRTASEADLAGVLAKALVDVPLAKVLGQLLADITEIKVRMEGEIISGERIDAILRALYPHLPEEIRRMTDDGPTMAVYGALRAGGLRLEEQRHGCFFDHRPIAWMSRSLKDDQTRPPDFTSDPTVEARWRDEDRIITPLFPGPNEGRRR
ncbi:hypothetical protein [Rhizobium sp. RAF56]|uniref:hypothetical protein n=1 Tax=Rhizobium sp. RAF56 TaxID=3233062 RepID=UPI003F99403B